MRRTGYAGCASTPDRGLPARDPSRPPPAPPVAERLLPGALVARRGRRPLPGPGGPGAGLAGAGRRAAPGPGPDRAGRAGLRPPPAGGRARLSAALLAGDPRRPPPGHLPGARL